MLIGIDGNEANVANRVGSNVYAYEVLRYLNKAVEKDPNLTAKVYLKNNFRTLLPPKTPKWQYSVFGPGMMWTQWRFPLRLFREKLLGKLPDVLFCPGHYAPRISPLPTVISIMDLAYLTFPQDFRKQDVRKLTAWTEYSVRNAAHILTISEATKQDVIKFYGINPEDITVTYPGLSASVGKTEKDNSFQHMEAFYGITRPYLVYVGTLQPRKNLIRLLEAFQKLKQSGQFQNVKLVLVGKKGWLYKDIFQKVNDLKLKQDAIFTGFVSDYEKAQLILHATALILPSLYEGFGIPVLEALAMGVPVIISKVSSLPEVGGEAAVYINNPESVDDIAKSMAKVLQLSENERMALIAKGKDQSEKFSWEACGKKTLEVLMKVGRE